MKPTELFSGQLFRISKLRSISMKLPFSYMVKVAGSLVELQAHSMFLVYENAAPIQYVWPL